MSFIVKEVIIKVSPLLYKSLISIALFFLILALIVFPFEEQGTPEFYVSVYGIVLLVLFIILVTLYYMKMKPIGVEEAYSIIIQ